MTRPLLILVASLLTPLTLPLVGIGPLTECGHCVTNYLSMLPVVPFMPLAAITGVGLGASPGGPTIAIAGLLLAGWIALAVIVARRAPRGVVAIVALTTTLLAIWGALGTAAALRA